MSRIFSDEQSYDERWLRSEAAGERLLLWAEETARSEFTKTGSHITLVMLFSMQDGHVASDIIATVNPGALEEEARRRASKRKAFAAVFVGQMAPEGRDETLQIVVEHVACDTLVGSVAKISGDTLASWTRCSADGFTRFLPTA